MKRSVSEIIRRGFDNTLANWPLLLLRVGETVVAMGMLVIAAIAAIVPIALSTGLRAADFDVDDAADPREAIFGLLERFWFVLLSIFAILLLVLLLWLLLHAFVTAGVTRVYVDGDRAAGEAATPRERFRVFSMERWLAGAREGWATVFWIYNSVLGLGGLILLIPLIAALALIIALRETFAAIAISCLSIAFAVTFGLVLVIVGSLWVQKAIIVAAARRVGTKEALAIAKSEFRLDFGRHAAVCLLMIAMSIGVSGVFGSMSTVIDLPFASRSSFNYATLPLHVGMSFLQFVASTAVGSWLLAAFAALSEEKGA